MKYIYFVQQFKILQFKSLTKTYSVTQIIILLQRLVNLVQTNINKC